MPHFTHRMAPIVAQQMQLDRDGVPRLEDEVWPVIEPVVTTMGRTALDRRGCERVD